MVMGRGYRRDVPRGTIRALGLHTCEGGCGEGLGPFRARGLCQRYAEWRAWWGGRWMMETPCRGWWSGLWIWCVGGRGRAGGSVWRERE